MESRKKLITNMLRQATKPIHLPADQPGAGNEPGTEGLENVRLTPLVPLITDRVFLDEVVSPVASSRDQALEGIDQVNRGDELADEQVDNAEAIILAEFRPCIDVIRGSILDFPSPWEKLAGFRSFIDTAIGAVGRIEVPQLPTVPYGGTGFVVGKNLILTNRHVAQLFTSGIGIKQLAFKADIGAAIDLKQEIIPAAPKLFRIKKTEVIHPYWDAALLSVEGLEDVEPLTLMVNPPNGIPSRAVAVIGYPMLDYRNDLDLQHRIFRGVYGKKRLMPGTLMGYATTKSFGREVEALTHDSSTLGGNSGSAVLDLMTGQVLGLHFAGDYMKANYAVPTWQLALDRRLVDLGVRFDGGTTPAHSSPPWLQVWESLHESPRNQPEPPGEVPGEVVPVEPARREAPDNHLPAVADWFERTTHEEIAAAYLRDPEGVTSLLLRTLQPDDAGELLADLQASNPGRTGLAPDQRETVAAEGLFNAGVDADLPEIIFLHGITGSHLATRGGLLNRLWLNPLAFLAGNMAEKLTLTNDGLADAAPGLKLLADGHIRYVYERAARTWRKQGFVVHEFAFDWRKSIAHSADRLHLFIENLRDERAVNRPFVLVAHSMGGLVAALYAQRHREWSDRVAQAFLLGTPLRGSYAPIEVVLGTYPFLLKLAKLSRLDDITDLRKMARTMPGLLDMLPDPAIFSDAAPVYRQQAWPDGIVPQQTWLAQSETLKTLYRESPLLARSVGIVSLAHATVGALTTKDGKVTAGLRTVVGDGTVPGKSAVIQGRVNFKVSTVHALIPRDPEVIRAIADIIRTGECNLPEVEAGDLDQGVAAAETIADAPTEAVASDVHARLGNGIFTQADFDWLVSPFM